MGVGVVPNLVPLKVLMLALMLVVQSHICVCLRQGC
jgi:hypothetical protein